MTKTRNYTEAERIRIQLLHEEGLSCRQIAHRVRKFPASVAALLQKLRQTGSVRDRRRTGWPRVTTARDDRNLCRMSLRDRKKTAVKLHKEWNNGGAVTASVRTTRRRLLDHGLRSCKARKKPLIKPDQERKRLAWARRHKKWTQRQWNRVLWSDESSFQLFATPGNVRVRRRPGEEWSKDCIVPTVKHGSGSVMVWGVHVKFWSWKADCL